MVSLDRLQKIGNRREYPPEQIEWYPDRGQCDSGILTNGKPWRLVPRDIERGRPRFTLAAIDRLMHHATILEMNVESCRRNAALERKRGPGSRAQSRQPP